MAIKGRLGNQMFQYAFARALQEKLKTDILIDWHYVMDLNKNVPRSGFEDSLKFFNTKSYISTDVCEYKKYMSFYQFLIYRGYEKGFPYNSSIVDIQYYQNNFLKKCEKYGFYFYENGFYNFDVNNIKKDKNLFLCGYYESTKYFSNIQNLIKQEFTPKNKRLAHNSKLYYEIENSESVCVTIRRGDFVGNKFHEVCDMNYFLNGMDIIKSKVPNARFFIFSNDVDWIRKNVKFKYPVIFEEGNDPVWEKLRLMYSCKHFVISNSTFSWWAQYLSSNEKKIIVAPDRWFNSELKSDLLNNDDFIKIK